MVVRKAKGQWVKSRKDATKKIYFLEAEGEMTLKFRAVYMYVDGKKQLIKLAGSFLKGDDSTKVRCEAEGILLALKAEKGGVDQKKAARLK